MRQFSHSTATRSEVPLLIGLAGPSGGGKTFSALRLATGIQRIVGGDIFAIDTESGRMLHYADRFKFQHVPFGEPFDSISYLEAIEYCVSKGAKVVVIDSMSHEHEGPGGMLEQHEAEVNRLTNGDESKAHKMQFSAWAKPKQARRKLINSLLQMNCNFVFCFRAKQKMKLVKKEHSRDGRTWTSSEPTPMGWMPIAGEEFVFEMTVSGLLLPNAGGVPEWNPHEDGEKTMVKLPSQFRELLLSHQGPLDESLGEAMAKWAKGNDPIGTYQIQIEKATTLDELVKAWKAVPKAYQKQLLSIKDARKAILETPQPEPAQGDDGGDIFGEFDDNGRLPD